MLPLEVLGENLFFASSSSADSWQSLQFLGLPLHYSNLCLHLTITFSSPIWQEQSLCLILISEFVRVILLLDLGPAQIIQEKLFLSITLK